MSYISLYIFSLSYSVFSLLSRSNVSFLFIIFF